MVAFHLVDFRVPHDLCALSLCCPAPVNSGPAGAYSTGVQVFASRAFSPIRKQAPAMYRHQGGIWLVRQKAHDSSTSAPSARKPRKEQSHRQK